MSKTKHLAGARHEFYTRQSPLTFVVACKCGWSHRETRMQRQKPLLHKLQVAADDHRKEIRHALASMGKPNVVA